MDDVKRKIAALLDDSGRTEEETRSARAVAARLMARHGLDEADLASGGSASVEHAVSHLGRPEWIMGKWLLVPIGELTGAKPITSKVFTSEGRRTDRRDLHWFGTPSSVEFAQWLTSHLFAQGRAAARTCPSLRDREDVLAVFASTVAKRISALVAETERHRDGDASCTALVVARDAAVDAAVRGTFPRLTVRRGSGRSGIDRRNAEIGAAAGQAASLGRPVSDSTGSVRLLAR